MPHGTSRNWEAFNVEEKDKRHRRASGADGQLRNDGFFDSERFHEVKDNQSETRRYAAAFNHKRRVDSKKLDRLRRQYLESLKQFNICPSCNFPIKLNPASGHSNNTRSAKVASHFEIRLDLERKKMTYVYVDGTNRNIRVEREERTRLRKAEKRRGSPEKEVNEMVTEKYFVEFFVEILPDGTKKKIVPKTFYSVITSRCICRKR